MYFVLYWRIPEYNKHQGISDTAEWDTHCCVIGNLRIVYIRTTMQVGEKVETSIG